MRTKLPLVSAGLSSSVSWSFHASTLIGAFLEMYAPTLVPRTHPRHLGPALGESTYPLGESTYPPEESTYPPEESTYPPEESTYPPEESTYPPEERRNLLGERTCGVGASHRFIMLSRRIGASHGRLAMRTDYSPT
jgi:hypothetical protein